MADPHTTSHLSNDEDNISAYDKSPTPEAQALSPALARLINIDQSFFHWHAVQAIWEIRTLWPDLCKTDFIAFKLCNLAEVLREGHIIVEQSELRAFLVAWKVLSVNLSSLDATGQAKSIRDMVVGQLGGVEKEVTASDDNNEKVGTTPRTKTDTTLQLHSSGSPSKPLWKAHKKLARQRQLNSLISQTMKSAKRKREEEPENDDPATHKDGVTATSMDDDESEITMEPIVLSTPEKTALTLQKLERKRKLEALAAKHKKRRYL